MTLEAVLFDCDGVLVDSEQITHEVIAENLARHGLRLSVAEVMALFVGGTMESAGETARAMGARLPGDWVAATYDEIFAALGAGTPLIPGVMGVLDAIAAAGLPVAVGSNGPHAKMAITLGQHPPLKARLGAHVYSREDVPRAKPAPDLYLHAAAALGVAAGRCAVIEDSASGVRAGRAAGMAVFGYAPAGDGARLADLGATVFGAMDELPALLGLR